MEREFSLPWDTSRFFEIIGKDPAKARIRGIANPSTCGRGAIKADCDAKTLDQWSRLQFGIYTVINNGGDDYTSITSCPALFV